MANNRRPSISAPLVRGLRTIYEERGSAQSEVGEEVGSAYRYILDLVEWFEKRHGLTQKAQNQ